MTLVSLFFSLFHSERESQLRATQEQAQKEIDNAWAQVKELQTKENQLKVWHEQINYSGDFLLYLTRILCLFS